MGWTVIQAGTARAVKADDLSVRLSLGQQGTARYSYFDQIGDDLPDENAAVKIINPEGLLVFGGTITSRALSLPNETKQETGDARQVTCECRDYNEIAYRRLVWLLAEDMTTGDIARALGAFVNTWGAEGLGISDITAGSGVLVPGQVFFDGVYLSEAMDFLARHQGGYWHIDASKSLHLNDLTATVAPIFVSAGNHPIKDIVVEKSLVSYRNVQYVFGSPVGQGTLFTETPANDATNGLSIVPTNYPIYSVESLTDIDGTTPLTVAIAGTDGAVDATYVPGEKNITLATPSAMSAGNWIVSYRPTRRVMGYAEREEDARYRLHEKIQINESLRTDDQCQQEADGLLERYPVATLVSYKTYRHGLLPGQSQSFNLPAYDVSVSLLIERVDFGKLPDAASEAARYSIGGSGGQQQMQQIFGELARRDESFVSGEGEKLDRFLFKNDNIGVGVSVVIAEV